MKITSPSGKVYEWTQEQPPTQQDIDAIVQHDAGAGSGAAPKQDAPVTQQAPASLIRQPDTTRSTVTGMTAQEAQARGEQGGSMLADAGIGAVRYGVPVAAGIAAAPFTAGMSILGGAAVMSGVGAVSSYGADLAAQGIEVATGRRDSVSQREAVGQGIMGATPFRGTGSLVERAATNIPLAIGFSEGARLAQNPDGYSPIPKSVQEGLMRYGIPSASAGLISAVGSAGQKLSSAGQQAQAIRAGSPTAAADFGVTMGREPLLQDLFGGNTVKTGGFINSIREPAAIERAAIARANPKALEAMDKALVGPSEGFAELNRQSPDLFPLTEDIRMSVGALEPVYQQAKASREAAQQFTKQAQELQMQGQAGAAQALEQARAARLKAFADEATYNLAWEKSLGRKAPMLQDVALGERNAGIAQAGEVARDARALAVSEAYQKAGIGENDAIVSLGDVLGTAQKKITANASRQDFVATLKSAFGDDPATVIDRTSFIEARDKLAAAITQRNPGIDPSAATRKANQFYQTMKEASLEFIGREMPDKLAAYTAAQARAAKFFDIADTNAYQLLAKGDADAFYKAAKSTGASANGVYDQAMRFASALREEGASAVADGLEKSVNTAIRDGVLDNAVNRGSGFYGARIVRAHDLVRELQGLQDAGFPVGKLGLGTVKDIQALARISSTAGGTGYTTTELSGFLDNVSKLGLDRASARLRYEKAVQASFLETDPAKRLQAAQKMRGEARRAGLDAQQQEAIAKRLEMDPLVKFLNEPGSVTALGLSKDAANNANFAETVLTLEPTMVSRMMDSLRASGRADKAKELEKAVVASVFGRFEKGTQQLDLGAVLNTFKNPANEGSVRSLRAVLGESAYASLRKNVVRPLEELAKSYERAGQPLPNSWGQVRAAITATTLAAKQSARGAAMPVYLANSLRGGVEALQNKQYNLLHTLYLNPNTAPKFARAGYSLNKFMQQPENAAALKLAQTLDKQANEESDPSGN